MNRIENAKELEAFVYREARLLDEWRLEEWLELFHEDAIYWIPMYENSDPTQVPSVTYDDILRLRLRVDQLVNSGDRASQAPRSETVHLISNIESESADRIAKVRYNAVIVELRPGDWRLPGIGNQRLLAARCFLQLRLAGTEWKILEKKIVLLNRQQPLEPLTVII